MFLTVEVHCTWPCLSNRVCYFVTQEDENKEEQDRLTETSDNVTKENTNTLRKQYQPLIDDLKSWVDAQENLDIYQYSAIAANCKQFKRSKCLDGYRMAAVIFIQCYGLTQILHWYFLPDTERHKEWCNIYGSSDSWKLGGHLTLLACSFAIFISLLIYNGICELNTQGIYSWGHNQPCFIDKGWIATGMSINLMVLVYSWLISVIVLFYSDNPLDMVLNSVAIYFIVELDDEAVFASDFQRINEWLDTHYDDCIDDYYENYVREGNTKQYYGKCDKYNIWIIKLVNFIGDRYYNRWFLLPYAFISPLYIFICY